LALSADGDHYAYLTENALFDPRGTVKTELIVDGKPVGYPGGNPQLTADGKHLFTGNANPSGQVVETFVDGKPFIRGKDVRLYIPPAGYRVVAVVAQDGARSLTRFVVVDGKKVPGSDAENINDVFFSPDGKHYAAACDTPSRSRFMLIDGKKGLEYQGFMALTELNPAYFMFSPDSSRSAYKAVSGNKSFIVVDGVESDGYTNIASFTFGGKDSRRVGFTAIGNSSNERLVVIDGKATPRPNANYDLTFSSDGARYAYTFNDPGGPNHRLVVDGVVEEGNFVESMANNTRYGVGFLFTPDVRHIVHYGFSAADRKMGFFIDGRFVPGRLHGNPTFTPDGRHHLWFEMVVNDAGRQGGYAIFVDGRPAYHVDVPGDDIPNLWTKTAGSWEMGADGVLTVIAREPDGLKRIRIAPPDDTSFDSLLSTATPMRGKTPPPH
jgi:hypothetical protein